MGTLKIVITVLQLLCGLAIILAVLFQSGKSAGLSGAIGGVADSFLAKNKAKTLDAKLARATKWVGALFLILTMVLLILGLFTAAKGGRCQRPPFFYPFPVRYITSGSATTPFRHSSSSTVTNQYPSF